jgi:hypothetical protein
MKQMTKIKGALSREIVAQPAEKIAKVAGINLPKGKTQPSDIELFGSIMYED